MDLAILPLSSLQLVPVTRIEIFTGNKGGQWRHKGDKDVSFGGRRQ